MGLLFGTSLYRIETIILYVCTNFVERGKVYKERNILGIIFFIGDTPIANVDFLSQYTYLPDLLH